MSTQTTFGWDVAAPEAAGSTQAVCRAGAATCPGQRQDPRAVLTSTARQDRQQHACEPPDVAPPIPCLEGDPDLWFAESPQALETAKLSCRRCPVRQACLAQALARAEPWGVWGGEILEDGKIIPYKRARGRPRKHTQSA